jgi:class 3 adenylate cyclase
VNAAQPAPTEAGPSAAVSFRMRLLLALTGTVAALALAGFVAVRAQTNRQVDLTISRSADRGQRVLAEIERFRRADLARVAARIAGSVRVVAAFDAARDDGDVDAFAEDVRYELTLAEFGNGLVEFSDERGTPVLSLVDGRPISATASDVEKDPAAADDTARSEYRDVGGALYSAQAHSLSLFGRTIGSVRIGFPIDASVAARFGELVDADVCFTSRGACLAATPAVLRSPTLSRRMVEAASARAPVVIDEGTRRLAIVSTRLPGATQAFAVIAVPLTDVLRPFSQIQRVENAAAGGALVLAVVLGVLLSQRLTAPIRTLVAATERVRQGDYTFTVTTAHADEFGALAHAFNQMTTGLLLKERYRSVLDKVVSPEVAVELMKGEIRLGGETRDMSILFADVRGFSALTEGMDPGEVVVMLNEWFDLAADIIQTEGGVVDKYAGDQVMALFGVPLPQEDHARRAVRAAVRIRDLTLSLNARRSELGRPQTSVGIGINSGSAVAGNVGSANRLNYTALGNTVNVASRLCSEAGRDEVLIGESTYAAVGSTVECTPLAPRIMKGLSVASTPYLVQRVLDSPDGGGGRPVLPTLALCLAALIGSASASRAQVLDPPTLSELGVEYKSAGGLVQVKPSLRLALDVFVPGDDGAGLVREGSPFVAGQAQVFVDVFIGRRVFASTELRVDRGQPPAAGSLDARVQQAFIRLTPAPTNALSVQVGKFITPFGSYPARAHTPADSFIRPPLLYDHRTVLQADFVPALAAGLLGWKDRPSFRVTGRPVVWNVPYPVGASVGVGYRGFRATAALLTSAPSADPEDWDRVRTRGASGPTFTGRLSYQFAPELRVGGSYSRGSYSREQVRDALGVVETGRQSQDIRAVDVTFRRGYTAIHGELVFNGWEVFRLAAHPRDVSYYVEGRRTIAMGIFAAVRYGATHFLDVEATPGTRARWDYDMRRWQMAAGYRLGRNSEVRAEYMINRSIGTTDPRDNMLSFQWWLEL